MGLVKDKAIEIRKEEATEILEQYGIKDLSVNNPDMNTNAYLHAIMKQNLVIIELLDKIANKL